MLFCSYVIFYSETNEWMKDWAKQWALPWLATTSSQLNLLYQLNLSQFHGNFISHERKSDLSLHEIYKALKPCWLLNWVSIARVVACFPQASRSRPAATAADSETPCVCARPSDPPTLCRSAAPRAWPLILQSNPSIVFSNSLREWLPDDTLVGRGGFTNPHPQDSDKLYGPCARPLQPYLPSIYVLFSSISDAWDIHTSFLDQPLMQLVIANAQFEPHKMIRVLHVKKVERKLQTILNFWW